MSVAWVKAAKIQSERSSIVALTWGIRLCPKRGFTGHRKVPRKGKPISKFMNQSSVFSSCVKETHFLATEKPFSLDHSSQADIKG